MGFREEGMLLRNTDIYAEMNLFFLLLVQPAVITPGLCSGMTNFL